MLKPLMNDQTDVLAIGVAYQDRLTKALASPAHETMLAPEPGLVLVEATCEEVTLAALVDPDTHTIRKAAYRGPASPIDCGLLEALCAILVTRPMLECWDHAAICLEHALRDPSHPRAVPGIIMPENADPAFRLPARLVRELAQEYWQMTGQATGENFFDSPASPAWRALTREERLQKVQCALADISVSLQLSDSAITTVTVEGNTRVFLDLVVDMPSAAKGALLMTIEAALKARVEATLHVYTVERKDLNKIRRLATPKTVSPANSAMTVSEGGSS